MHQALTFGFAALAIVLICLLLRSTNRQGWQVAALILSMLVLALTLIGWMGSVVTLAIVVWIVIDVYELEVL